MLLIKKKIYINISFKYIYEIYYMHGFLFVIIEIIRSSERINRIEQTTQQKNIIFLSEMEQNKKKI